MLSYLGDLCVGSQRMIPHIEQRSAIDTNLLKTNETLSFCSKMHHIATSCNSMAATMDRLSTRIVVRDAYLCLAVLYIFSVLAFPQAERSKIVYVYD